jgi:hypothetical protein
MRAFPGDWLANFSETDLGNTAFPEGVGELRLYENLLGLVAGAAPVVVAAAAGAAAAFASHSDLRKAFHFMPPRFPADFVALYLALQSCMLNAWARVGKEQAHANNKTVAAGIQ